ncbi:MAG: TauD/TfdA family dioxygenase [Albidovulum sp.]|nr:TauD/TfdA family dioxygenase [Albidovulum sp.]
MKQFSIEPVTPLIGAEVSGVDLSRLDDDHALVIKNALLDRLVLFFRDQDLSIKDQIALGRRFGKLHVHPAGRDIMPHEEGLPPEIFCVFADANTTRAAGDKWHTDISCDLKPPAISILKMDLLPSLGGDTLFSNMYAAYEALSDPMKEMLGGLTATHDGGPNYRDRAKRGGLDPSDRKYPRHSHPVVRTHPETRRKALFVNATFTTHIDGIPEDESRALLEFLFQHTAKAMFQCRFRWKPNSVAMWDNRCAMHYAVWDYHPEVRSGRRVTIEGDRPF